MLAGQAGAAADLVAANAGAALYVAGRVESIADGVAIRNKPKHLEACIHARHIDAPAARRLATEHPDWTPTQIANHIQDPDAARKARAANHPDMPLPHAGPPLSCARGPPP